MTDPLLKIPNHHSASCGDPPTFNGDANSCYIGYFENPYGEQWIFIRDRKTGEAFLRGGDAGWNNAFQVIDGRVANLILGKAEQIWLQACWLAGQ